MKQIGRNSPAKLLRYLSLVWKVNMQLLFFRPQLCYLTPTARGAGFYKDALIILSVKLFGVKTVFHYHNKGVSSRQEHFFDDLLYRLVFRNSYVILLSKQLYPDIQKYVPEDRVYYCPNGIPDGAGHRAQGTERRAQGKEKGESVGAEHQPSPNLRIATVGKAWLRLAKQDSGHGEGSSEHGEGTDHLVPINRDTPPDSGGETPSLVITRNPEQGTRNEEQGTRNEGQETLNNPVELLFLSHLIRSKGVLVLIDACAMLKERGAAFHCTIAGGDAEMTRETIEGIIKSKGLERFISVVGPKHNEEKLKMLGSADIFVHPSYNDCMPLILLEAMQFALPVVSTFEGAIPDIVEDGVTGFLVPQKDSTALAEKLEVLVKDPRLREKMGNAGRARYEQQFTLEKFEGRMVEILREVGSELK